MGEFIIGVYQYERRRAILSDVITQMRFIDRLFDTY